MAFTEQLRPEASDLSPTITSITMPSTAAALVKKQTEEEKSIDTARSAQAIDLETLQYVDNLPTFENEDDLYKWMDSMVEDKFYQAMNATQQWWFAAMIAYAAAREFHGCARSNLHTAQDVLPPVLIDWCNRYGLESEHKRACAKNHYKSLTAKPDECSASEFFLSCDHVTVSEQIGKAPVEIRPFLYQQHLNGATLSTLKMLTSEYNKTSSYLEHRLREAIDEQTACHKRFNNYTGKRSTSNSEYSLLLVSKQKSDKRVQRFREKLNGTTPDDQSADSILKSLDATLQKTILHLSDRERQLTEQLSDKKDKQTKAAEKAAKQAARKLQVLEESQKLSSFDMEKARKIRVERITNHLLLCNNGVRGDIESFFLEMEHYPKKDVSRILHLVSNLKETLEHFIPND